MLEINSIYSAVCDVISPSGLIYNFPLRSSFCLPFGKADHTPSTALSRTRRSLLQPHPVTPCTWGILDFRSIEVLATFAKNEAWQKSVYVILFLCRICESCDREGGREMKRLSILVILGVVLCFVPSSYGLDSAGRGFYVGIGGSYALEDFDVGYGLEVDGVARTVDMDFDNTWGLNAKVGNHVTDWLSFEFEFNYLSDFEAKESLVVLDIPVAEDGDADIATYMAVAKLTCVLEPVKPYIVAGGGIMDADLHAKASALGVSASDSESETDTCAKLGLGADFFATQSVSIGVEGSYVWGFGDVDNIRYLNLSLGLGYHF
jgi:opacity protein-like surface antigen